MSAINRGCAVEYATVHPLLLRAALAETRLKLAGDGPDAWLASQNPVGVPAVVDGYRLRQITDCQVRQAPQLVRSLLATQPGERAERQAAEALFAGDRSLRPAGARAIDSDGGSAGDRRGRIYAPVRRRARLAIGPPTRLASEAHPAKPLRFMPDAQPHLYLVDGSSYIFRAYHRLPPLTNRHGQPAGAVYGYTTMLWKLADGLNKADGPTHMAVILDKSEHTFRNEMYDQYKAHRPPPPEDLVPQFPLIRDATRAFSIPCIEEAGLEADDIIACYVKAALARRAGRRPSSAPTRI